MPTSVPKPFTLNIQVGDSINLKGVIYTITNVGAGVDNGNGVINYAVTLNDPNTTVLTCNANNTVLHGPGVELNNAGGVTKQTQGWRQSGTNF